jgi:PAS domain S-box-containing protein
VNEHYAYTPHIWPTVGTILLLLFLLGYSWQRRSVPGLKPFLVYLLCGLCYLPFKVLEYLATDFPTKVIWFRIGAIWWLPLVATMTCFILEYTYPGRWLTRFNLTLLTALVLLFVGVGLTNDYNHLTFRSFAYKGSVVPLYGPWFWFVLTFAIGLTVISIIVFTWLFIYSPQHRWPVVFLLAATLLTRSMYIVNPFPADSWSFYFPVVGVSFIACAIALFGFRIFDPIPLARRTAVEQMHAGMLVLDLRGQVASLNPAAEQILGVSVKQARNQPVKVLLPAYLEDPLNETVDLEIEIDHRDRQETRSYTLSISPLKDWRGLEAGKLLLLGDVTEQKQAQAQIIEHQRALAVLKEREQLARELHDSTSQVLAYAGFQLEAIGDRIRKGEGALSSGNPEAARNQLLHAEDQLDRISTIVGEAQADVREYILNLRLAPSEKRPFFATLRHYLDGFRQNYGLPVELSLGEGVGEETLDYSVQLQLFRIIQEAFSNARKHAGASCVQISFALQDSQVHINIQDDGHGFDPAQLERDQTAEKPAGHFGLAFMRERAEQIGASLQIRSAPGEGTYISLDVPSRANGEQKE